MMGLMLAAPMEKVAAQRWSSLQGELGVTCVSGYKDGEKDVATIQGAACLIANAAQVVFSLLGFAGVIMLVVGGFQYMFAGGNASKAQKARGSITGVIIGLLLALSSFMIVRILEGFTGLNLTTIVFPQ